MSNAWSGVLRSDFVWLLKSTPHIHSYSRMMRDAGLPERSGSDAYAKIEVTPTDGCYLSDPMTWAVKIDEPRTPEWVRDEWARVEDSARRQAKAWAREHIMRGDGGDYKVGAGEVLIVYGSPAKIRVAKDGVCQTRDTSAPRAIRVADGGVCHTRDTSAPGEIRVSKAACTTPATPALRAKSTSPRAASAGPATPAPRMRSASPGAACAGPATPAPRAKSTSPVAAGASGDRR